MAIDGVWVPIVLFATAPIMAIGIPIARAYARKIEKGGTSERVPSDVSARLERMEQAIDSIAVEVERISEGQRSCSQSGAVLRWRATSRRRCADVRYSSSRPTPRA